MAVESWGCSWIHSLVIRLKVFSTPSVEVFIPFKWGIHMLTKLIILKIALVVWWNICHTDLKIVHIGNHDYIAFTRLDGSCQLSLFALFFVTTLFASSFWPKSFLESNLLFSLVHILVLTQTTLAQVWVLVCFLRLSTLGCYRSKLVSL